ncbi:MAG TPA: hypothetical protein VKZ79_19420 [Alphaproteobacteria bacterium]|nr:hypothetical protein [Alphaproteobacteria bacterium]
MKDGNGSGEDLRKKAERLRDLALEELRRRGMSESEIKEIRTGIKERPTKT